MDLHMLNELVRNMGVRLSRPLFYGGKAGRKMI